MEQMNFNQLPIEVINFTNALMRVGEVQEEPGVIAIEAEIDMGDGLARVSVKHSKTQYSLRVSFNGEYLVLDMQFNDDNWIVDGPLTVSNVEYSEPDLWRLLEELEQLTSEVE